MAKDPTRRFKTAGELAAALGQWLRAAEGGRVETAASVSATAEVFMSFSHVDQSVAQTACDSLEADGLRCWISPRDVVAGRSWDESSGKAIKESRAVVLVLSASANKSERVLREIEHAAKCKVPVVTFRVQDVPPGVLTPHLRGPHKLDALTEPFESHLSRLCEVVRTVIPYAPHQMPACAVGHALRSCRARSPGGRSSRRQRHEDEVHLVSARPVHAWVARPMIRVDSPMKVPSTSG